MENPNILADLAAFTIPLFKAIVIIVVGLWAIGWATTALSKVLTHKGWDEALSSFLESLANIGLKVILAITAASMVGIETTSFIALLGAAGLAIGLALQGSLANFAGGVLILVFKPYKIGDFVEAAGKMGVVNSIKIFNTVLMATDNKTIIIPNGAICNDAITNYSMADTRRVDIDFGIGYDDDLRKAKTILLELITADERILKDPEAVVVISSLGDSCVNITTRSWVNSADYWGVYFDLMENVKLAFDEQGISIPYPQTDVHLYKEDSASSK